MTPRKEPTKGRQVRQVWCWSGGGLPALDVHVGMWRALSEHGYEATAHCGTSAGAIVAAMAAAGRTPAWAEMMLRQIRDDDVRQHVPLWWLRLPWIDHILEPAPIAGVLRKLLPKTFWELETELRVCCTDELACEPAFRETGDLVSALMASTAISGVWPPVDKRYSDGAATANLPLPPNWRDADELVLLVARRSLRYPGQSVLTRLIRYMDMLAEDQVRDTIRTATRSGKRVTVLRPHFEPERGLLHFEHDLIETAYEYAHDELARAGD